MPKILLLTNLSAKVILFKKEGKKYSFLAIKILMAAKMYFF